jgi:hypothetical protein
VGQAFNPAIAEMGDRLRSGGHIVFMGDHHEGDALLMQIIKQIQHVVGGAGIQCTCGFVGEE